MTARRLPVLDVACSMPELCARLLQLLPSALEAAVRLGATTTLELAERTALDGTAWVEVAVEAGDRAAIGVLLVPGAVVPVAEAALLLGWYVQRDAGVAARWVSTTAMHVVADGVAYRADKWGCS